LKYVLPENLRAELSKPLGSLIRGNIERTIDVLKNIISHFNIKGVVSVGDIVTFSLITRQVYPIVSIVDYRSLRRPLEHEIDVKPYFNMVLRVTNEPGTISEEAIQAVRKAFDLKTRVLIEVICEEDLLTIPAVIYAPENYIVTYGQPNEGIVVIIVDRKSKDKFKNILSKFIKVQHDP